MLYDPCVPWHANLLLFSSIMVETSQEQLNSSTHSEFYFIGFFHVRILLMIGGYSQKPERSFCFLYLKCDL